MGDHYMGGAKNASRYHLPITNVAGPFIPSSILPASSVAIPMGSSSSKDKKQEVKAEPEPLIKLAPGLEKKWLRGEMESVEEGQGQGNERVNRKELDVAYQKGQDDMQAKIEKELATKRAKERDAERKATLDQEESLANKVSSKLEELNKKYYRAPIKPVECVDLRDAVQKCYEAAGSDPLVCKDVVEAFNGCSSKAVAKLISN